MKEIECPFFPQGERTEIKCDYLIKKDPAYKTSYTLEFCKGRFKDCAYYFHLSKWLERISDAMKEDGEDE